VLPFVFRHWRNQPVRLFVVSSGLIGVAAADVFMPLFAGRLVDAVTLAATNPAAAQRGAMRSVLWRWCCV
jgi:ATP-binding cassette, subfamily B, bacterial